MSDRFALCAARLAGLVCRHLAWRPADFWSATPDEIASIYSSEPAAGNGGVSRSELETLLERDSHG